MSSPMRKLLAALILVAVLGFGLAPAPIARAAAPLAQGATAAACDNILLSTQLSGRTVDAADELDLALAALQAAPDPDLEELGKCALYSGILYQGAGDFSTALEAYTIARDAFVQIDDVQMTWTARYGRAAILMARGRADDALAELEAALALTRQEACWLPQDIKPIAEAVTLNNIGAVLAITDQFETADEQVAAALTMLEEQAAKAPVAEDSARAGLLDQLVGGTQPGDQGADEGAALAELLGQLVGGTQPGDQGTDEGQGLDGAIPPEALGELLGGLLGAASGPCAGAQGFGGIITTMLLGGRIGPQLATILAPVALNNRGEIARRSGDLTRAEALLSEALARLDAGEGAGGAFTAAPSAVMAAAVENNLGMVAYDREAYSEALERFESAEGRLRALGQRRSLPSILTQLGYTEQLLGNGEAAAAHYAEAMAILDQVQAIDDGGAAQVAVGAGMGGPTTAASLGGSLAPFADVYNLAAGLAFSRGDIAEAFAITERGRARLFLDTLRAASLRADDPTAAALLDRERKAAFLLAATADQVVQAEALTPPNPQLEQTSRGQLARAEARYAAVLTELGAADERLKALVTTAEDALSLAQTQQELQPDTTLVSYYQFDPRTPGLQGAIAFVITRDDVAAVALPEATPAAIGDALERLRSQGWSSLETLHPQALVDLHRMLVADLELRTPLVGIIPHQTLHKVPFAALSDGASYFGGRYTLFQLPSASALPAIRANGGDGVGPTAALIFGNPVPGLAGLGGLRAAADEAAAVAATLGQQEWTGREASELRLRDQAAASTVLHLAAHGVYSATSPLDSAIYLTPGSGEDGALTAGEVLTLDLRQSELVTLSACESNLGELSGGDELLGLTRAFFTAGAPAVISTLWLVDDQATSQLMAAFYRAWQRDGVGRAEALRMAQEELRQSEDYANPYYWAAFTLSGDPSAGAARFALPEPTATPAPPTATPAPTLAPPTATPAPTFAPPTATPAPAGGVAPPADGQSAPTPVAPGPGAALCGFALVLPVGFAAALWRRIGRRRR